MGGLAAVLGLIAIVAGGILLDQRKQRKQYTSYDGRTEEQKEFERKRAEMIEKNRDNRPPGSGGVPH
ncbi:hypothetical protein ACFO4L_13695 [Bacillus daqingensis]|uniref:Secreted protein n=1 Tax=Bacillus daqingensis TaxID=872396 RepID=A0ABV9NW88_9BACI